MIQQNEAKKGEKTKRSGGPTHQILSITGAGSWDFTNTDFACSSVMSPPIGRWLWKITAYFCLSSAEMGW